MLEILGLIWLGRHLAGMARSKNRSVAYAVLGPGLWIVFEFVGACMAGAMGFGGLGLYGVALVSAFIGGAIGFAIVSALPVYHEDEDEFPAYEPVKEPTDPIDRDNVWSS